MCDTKLFFNLSVSRPTDPNQTEKGLFMCQNMIHMAERVAYPDRVSCPDVDQTEGETGVVRLVVRVMGCRGALHYLRIVVEYRVGVYVLPVVIVDLSDRGTCFSLD